MAATLLTSPVTHELVASFRERLLALDSNLEPDSGRYGAGLLLLALTALPVRVDRLAVQLGLKREFVAQCLRRLVDNGVLQKDSLVCVWDMNPKLDAAFWADVNVALGIWWRRQDARGNLEWTDAGGWRKPYDFVGGVDDLVQTNYVNCDYTRPRMKVDCFAFQAVSGRTGWIGSTPVGASSLDPWHGADGAPGREVVPEAPIAPIGLAADSPNRVVDGFEGHSPHVLPMNRPGAVWLA